MRIAWSGGRVPAIGDVLTPAVIADDAALAHVLAADLHERSARGLACSAQDYVGHAPDLLGRESARQTLFMASLSQSRALGETVSASADALRSAFPQHAAEIRSVAALAAALDEALAARAALSGGDRRGKYELLALLGEGAFAQTWRARDTVLERDVALKIIPLQGLSDGESRRLLAEARSIAQVRHDAVVTIHEAGRFEPTGEVFLDMDLIQVDGASRTLASLMEEGPAPAFAAARIIAAISHALAAAHARGVLHRDLKPANILLDGAERPRLCDFGLALVAASDAAEGTRRAIVGTPAYIAPEVAAGQSATPLSDVYSLGATLRALLAGRDPRSTASGGSREMLRLAATVPLPPIRRDAPHVPLTLAAIVDRSTAHAPEHRYDSASQFAADLDAFGALLPTAARPLTLLGRAGLWFARNRTVASVAGLSLLTLAVTIGAFVLRLAEERDSARAAKVQAQEQRDAAVAARDVIESQNRFVSRAFNAARGRYGLGTAGADVPLRQALEMIGARADRAFDDRPLVLAATYVFLAQAHASIGEHEHAETFARRAVDIRVQSLGPTHPESISARCTLANALVNGRKFDQGYPMVREIYADMRDAGMLHAPDGLWVRLWKARADDADGGQSDAVAARESLAEEYRAAPFSGSMDRQSVLNDLVQHRLRLGDAAAAEQIQREIIEFVSGRLGPGDISTLNASRTLVYFLRRRKAAVEASDLNASLLEKYRAILPAGHAVILSVVLEQAGIELDRDAADALAFATEAAAITDGRARSNPERLRSQIALGRARRLVGESESAEAALRAAFEDAITHKAAPAIVAEAGSALRQVLAALGRQDEAAQIAAREREAKGAR